MCTQDITCSAGINWIKIYDAADCLDPPNQELLKPGSACFYPNGWFIKSFAVMSSLLQDE
jgi:hypothetical protein